MSKTAKTVRPSTAAPSAPAAPAPSSPRADVQEPKGPVIATKVYMHAFSSGPRGCLSAMPLHEIVLCKRKLEIFGESLTLVPEWPTYIPRAREMSAVDMHDEQKRLATIYTFEGNDGRKYDLVSDIYGAAGQSRLRSVMRKQHEAWLALEKKLDGKLVLEHWQDLALLADPEQEFIEPGDLVAAAVKP